MVGDVALFIFLALSKYLNNPVFILYSISLGFILYEVFKNSLATK